MLTDIWVVTFRRARCMIIENGTLQIIETTGGGMEGGIPVPIAETAGEPIACNIKTNTNDNKGKTIDNVFTRASYEVLIDVPEFTSEKVILTDNRGKRIGTYRVQDVQHLDFVNAVKITV